MGYMDAAAYQEALERSYQKALHGYVQIEFMLVDHTLMTVRGWLTHITDTAVFLEDLRIPKQRIWTFHPAPHLVPRHRRPEHMEERYVLAIERFALHVEEEDQQENEQQA